MTRKPASTAAAAAIAAAALLGAASAAPPELGPWPVGEATYKVPTLDATDPSVWLVYAECNVSSCPKFPLISYSHGLLGGDIDLLGYADFFYQIASWGFVIAAPDSCDVGCTDKSGGAPWTDCAGLLPVQPAGWAAWYGEQIKAIDWARNMSAAGGSSDPVFASIDWAAGVGIAGHSMGGQATALSAGAACAQRWDIRAAVLHHPASGALPGGANIGVNMSVPVAGFTSSGDSIFPETFGIMAAFNSSSAAATLPNALKDATGWSHLEPVLIPPIENPLLATFTAAWFKVFLNNDKNEFFDMVFGSGPDSFCKHANMTACYVLNAPS